MKPCLFLGVGKDCRALDVDAIFICKTQDGAGQFRLQIFRTISEICFSRSYMCRIRHRVFPSFRKTIDAVRKLSAFLFIQYITHNNNFL